MKATRTNRNGYTNCLAVSAPQPLILHLYLPTSTEYRSTFGIWAGMADIMFLLRRKDVPPRITLENVPGIYNNSLTREGMKETDKRIPRFRETKRTNQLTGRWACQGRLDSPVHSTNATQSMCFSSLPFKQHTGNLQGKVQSAPLQILAVRRTCCEPGSSVQHTTAGATKAVARNADDHVALLGN